GSGFDPMRDADIHVAFDSNILDEPFQRSAAAAMGSVHETGHKGLVIDHGVGEPLHLTGMLLDAADVLHCIPVHEALLRSRPRSDALPVCGRRIGRSKRLLPPVNRPGPATLTP